MEETKMIESAQILTAISINDFLQNKLDIDILGIDMSIINDSSDMEAIFKYKLPSNYPIYADVSSYIEYTNKIPGSLTINYTQRSHTVKMLDLKPEIVLYGIDSVHPISGARADPVWMDFGIEDDGDIIIPFKVSGLNCSSIHEKNKRISLRLYYPELTDEILATPVTIDYYSIKVIKNNY
jgi:hypothetical protein